MRFKRLPNLTGPIELTNWKTLILTLR